MRNQHDIVDIGVNLAHRSFHGDLKAVIQRAFDAGVRTMVVTGTSQASSREAQQIARDYPGQLFSTAGVHPHDSRNCTMETMTELRRLAALEQVLAIGECGLDFNRDFSSRPLQEKRFEAQVAMPENSEEPAL